MKYTYQARTKTGEIKTGVIEASSRETAATLLQKYDIFVTTLKEETDKVPFLKINFERKISTKGLAVFARQLAVMLESRVPVVQSLTSLAIQADKLNFKKVVLEVSHMVEEGVSLSEALSHYPKIFDSFFVNLIKSGEVSGKISSSLYYIADHLESEDEIISQVRQAMIYPIFTVSILFVVVNIIIIFLLPKIQQLIGESATAPSGFTLLTLHFYTLLEKYWWMVLVALFLSGVIIVFYARTSEGKKNFDRYAIKIPVLGDILRKVFLSRFCGNIAILMSAGISINKSLKITEDTVNNAVYKEMINQIGLKVSEGESISSVLVQYQYYFPTFVIQMIKVGEETGKLDKTLLEVVKLYDKEIKRAIALFLALLEPMLIIFLGLVVGVLALSVFAPLYGALGNV